MTPHINAKKEDIAPIVIMPGDPLRAKMIAQTYLTDYKLVNEVRGMLAYTGYYNNKLVTIMGSGMGMPSMGIYSYELFKFYDVEKIIRVGSCGAYTADLNLYDLILVTKSYSKSSYAQTQNNCPFNTLMSSTTLNEIIRKTATDLSKKINEGTIYSSDVFYSNEDIKKLNEEFNCLGVEMESFALFHNANILNKDAACILTVSDNLITKEETTPEERQNSFHDMISLALNSLSKVNL